MAVIKVSVLSLATQNNSCVQNSLVVSPTGNQCTDAHLYRSISVNQVFYIFVTTNHAQDRARMRAGCWGCWCSGEVLSNGGYRHNTPLVYFVSEEDFPSGVFIKSALPVYDNFRMQSMEAEAPHDIRRMPLSFLYARAT